MPWRKKTSFLRIVLERDEVSLFVQHDGMLNAVDPEEDTVNRAVYLILAELANLRKTPGGLESTSPRTARYKPRSNRAGIGCFLNRKGGFPWISDP